MTLARDICVVLFFASSYFAVAVVAKGASRTLIENNVQNECESLKNGNNEYKCKQVDECHNGFELLENGKAIPCGPEGEIPYVCCPPQTAAPSSRRPVRQIQRRRNSNQLVDPYKVAQQKCKDYSEYRYVNVTVNSFIINQKPTVRRKLECVKAQELIVGGKKAKLKEYPHMALIGYHDTVSSPDYERWLCGGSLISERYVLSAAHCSTDASGDAKWARLGELVIGQNTDGARPHDFRIVQRINHPKYTSSSVYHDIALFRLHADVKLNDFIRPICLHTTISMPANAQLSVTGWGTTGLGERTSDELLKATINLYTEEECKAAYTNDKRLRNGYDKTTMVCAAHRTENRDTCGGDSGGPAQIPLSNWFCMWSLVGVTSYGSAACGNHVPAIYTKVAYYIPWIQPIVWP